MLTRLTRLRVEIFTIYFILFFILFRSSFHQISVLLPPCPIAEPVLSHLKPCQQALWSETTGAMDHGVLFLGIRLR